MADRESNVVTVKVKWKTEIHKNIEVDIAAPVSEFREVRWCLAPLP